MKRSLLIVSTFLSAVSFAQNCSDLFISEYVEGELLSQFLKRQRGGRISAFEFGTGLLTANEDLKVSFFPGGVQGLPAIAFSPDSSVLREVISVRTAGGAMRAT